MKGKTLCLAVLSLGAASGAFAQAFDYESVASGDYAGSLTMTVGSQSLTVTAEGFPGGSINVQDPSVGLLGAKSATASQGAFQNVNQFAATRMTFLVEVTSVTLAFGDGGGDEDSPVEVTAYDSAGNVLDTLVDTYPASFADGKTGTLSSAAGIKYLICTSGIGTGFNENSLYWEVVGSTPVPEPATLAVLGLGAAAAIRRRRR